jgi:hypothetical protein
MQCTAASVKTCVACTCPSTVQYMCYHVTYNANCQIVDCAAACHVRAEMWLQLRYYDMYTLARLASNKGTAVTQYDTCWPPNPFMVTYKTI